MPDILPHTFGFSRPSTFINILMKFGEKKKSQKICEPTGSCDGQARYCVINAVCTIKILYWSVVAVPWDVSNAIKFQNNLEFSGEDGSACISIRFLASYSVC